MSLAAESPLSGSLPISSNSEIGPEGLLVVMLWVVVEHIKGCGGGVAQYRYYLECDMVRPYLAIL